MFIGFTNFYLCFIQDFSKIAILPILMLKTTKLSNNGSIRGSDISDKIVVELFISKKAIYISNIRVIEELNFLTPNIK